MCILMPIKCFLKYLIACAIEGHLLFKVGFRVVMTGDTNYYGAENDLDLLLL